MKLRVDIAHCFAPDRVGMSGPMNSGELGSKSQVKQPSVGRTKYVVVASLIRVRSAGARARLFLKRFKCFPPSRLSTI